MSQPIFLDKCRIYKMEAFMKEETSNDHISVGMRKPSGGYERPIPGTRLFWTKPGNFVSIFVVLRKSPIKDGAKIQFIICLLRIK